jgi:hypothetical protein
MDMLNMTRLVISLTIGFALTNLDAHAATISTANFPKTSAQITAAGISTFKKQDISQIILKRIFPVASKNAIQAIQTSISDYEGTCPCPYNLYSNGRVCGGSSAFSKERGLAPICFPEQVN